MQHKGLIISIVAVIVILAGVIGLSLGNNNKNDSDTNMKMGTNSSSSESTQSSQSSQQSNTSNAVEATSVVISNFAYSPPAIKVKVGQTVTWTNNDPVAHTVTADNTSSDAPNSKLLNKGESYTFTFNKAGTYAYHCTPHPYMKGTVVVSE
jgi:amicyanin